jgi:hypothetical protein
MKESLKLLGGGYSLLCPMLYLAVAALKCGGWDEITGRVQWPHARVQLPNRAIGRIWLNGSAFDSPAKISFSHMQCERPIDVQKRVTIPTIDTRKSVYMQRIAERQCYG